MGWERRQRQGSRRGPVAWQTAGSLAPALHRWGAPPRRHEMGEMRGSDQLPDRSGRSHLSLARSFYDHAQLVWKTIKPSDLVERETTPGPESSTGSCAKLANAHARDGRVRVCACVSMCIRRRVACKIKKIVRYTNHFASSARERGQQSERQHPSASAPLHPPRADSRVPNSPEPRVTHFVTPPPPPPTHTPNG